MPSEYPNNNERMIFSMSVLKSKAKSVIAIFICLSLLFGEVMFFPLNSKAETLPIEQSAPLLDVEVDEEEFIIDEGEEGGIRHFPFVFGFGDDIFVSFSQHKDELINHAVDGMRISRDGGTTWSTYIEDQDFYLTSLIKLNNGDLFGISYPSYYIDERHASLKYAISKDNGETWIHSEGTVEFPKDISKSADSDWASMVPYRSIMQMPDGTLYGTMYGTYAIEGEINYRSIWIKSTDGGENWTVVSDIAVLKGVAGEPQSYCEPTFEVCSDGSILCVLRTASGGDAAHPLYQCRSTDGGLTWSTPEIIPGVTVDDAGCADPCLYMMSNGVLVLSYGRQHCKMLFSGDGTGETWTNFTTTFTETAEKISSCYTDVYEVSPGKLLLVGDKAGANGENQKIWGKYVYVTKHNVAYESGVDAGHVDINGNTYTARPYDGNAFLGWYNSKGTLISTNVTETFADTDGVVTPKFRNNSVFKSPGFEYVELGSTHTKDPSTAIFPSWYTSQDWGSVNILTSETYDDGFRSMRVFSPYRVDLYTDITGLRQNTTYTVSYRWMMPRDYTTENNDCYNGLVASSPEYTSIGDAYKNTIGKSYYARYPQGGVWNKDTFTFNTGDLTTVRLFMDYASLASSAVAVYIDDFTIYKNPEPLSVSIESGTDAGYITNEGNVYTAVPYDGNKFLGWYNSTGVISTNPTEFFADTDGAITAKFKNNSIFESPSFELNSVGTTYQYYEHSSDKDGWYITATWGWAKTVNNIAHSGSKALQIHGRFQTIYKNIIGLKPNTDYTVSYYWTMPNTYTTANNNVYHGMVAAGNEYTAIGVANSNKLGGTYGVPKYPEAGVWKKDTFTFNTGDLSAVKLFIYYDSSGDALYLDDFTIFETPEPLSVSVESGTDAGYITNEGNVYTAVPYDGNEFLGWYNADGLVSAELTYDFKDLGGAVTAKFKNNSIFESPSFELNSVGTTYQYHEHSADKEGWYISADWGSARIVNNLAHSGSNSLAVFGRYQLIYTNILGLKPNTNYTVSYYWMMNESYTAENNNAFNGMLVGSTAHNSIGEAYVNALGSTYGGHNVEGGVWQKDTATFNTGDLSSVRLFFEYNSANATLYIDDFTVYEISENLYDYDADLNSGKFVNSGAVNITEVNTNESEAELLGNKVYKMDTSADFTSGYISDTMFLTGGKRYDVSFYFKVADGHSMLTATDAKQYITFFMQKSLTDSANIQLEEAYTVTRNSINGAKVIYATNTDEFSIDKTQVVDENGATQWQKITASFTPATNTTAVFAIRPNAAGTVYFDQLKVTSAQNAIDEVQSALSVVGTAIRTNGKQALRFKSSIDKTAISKLYFDTYELVEYGSVAIKTSYLGDNELVMGSYTQEDGTEQESHKGAAYIKDDRNIIFADKGSTIHFTAALTGISEENYNTAYSVRTYAVLQRPDGSTFTIYNNETVTATVYDIAVLAYNATGDKDGYAESADVREYLFTNIIDKADFEKFPNDGFKVK